LANYRAARRHLRKRLRARLKGLELAREPRLRVRRQRITRSGAEAEAIECNGGFKHSYSLAAQGPSIRVNRF
jgi:hypothetical protein